MNRGKFITIEGSEGVGKTTQIAALRDSLRGARAGSHRHARAGRHAARGDASASCC